MLSKKIVINDKKIEYAVERDDQQYIEIEFEGVQEKFQLISYTEQEMILASSQGQFKIHPGRQGHFVFQGYDFWLEDESNQRRSKSSAGNNQMLSPMPGKILKVLVEVGQEVKEGEALLVMEAMKMEHTIKAAFDGTISKLDYKEDELVAGGVELISIDHKTE